MVQDLKKTLTSSTIKTKIVHIKILTNEIEILTIKSLFICTQKLLKIR